MSEFNPGPNERITIGGHLYAVMPHPAVPAFAFGQEGRKAFVFQISGGMDSGLYALKKFKQVYRVPELVEVNDSLARFSSWPGLEVCYRQCIQFGSHDDILGQHPDLEYAVLMPWISGRTWYDIVVNGTPLTRLESLTFANAVAQVLAALEESQLAHCDIAAANVIVNGATGRAHLIDVEDIYAPGFSPPAALPAGTEGYAHRTSSEGQWGPYADRFSGAVLIAEMMGWHAPKVRKESDEEHYFGADELQSDNARYQLMQDVLGGVDSQLAGLFEQAWYSETLDACPSMREWQEVVEAVFHQERLSKVVSDWQPLTVQVNADTGSGATSQEETLTEYVPVPETSEADRGEPTRVEQAAEIPEIPRISLPPAPVAPAPMPASRPIMPAVESSRDGPVKEWRPLAVSSSFSGAGTVEEQQRPSLSSSPTLPQAHVTFEPIMPPPQEPDVEIDASSPKEEAPPTLEVEEEVVATGSQRPQLFLSHMEDDRPSLVWTEVQDAERYTLEEGTDPDFNHASQHLIEQGETRWQKPRKINPFRRRTEHQYYRVQAIIDGIPGAWSDVLVVAPDDR